MNEVNYQPEMNVRLIMSFVRLHLHRLSMNCARNYVSVPLHNITDTNFVELELF